MTDEMGTLAAEEVSSSAPVPTSPNPAGSRRHSAIIARLLQGAGAGAVSYGLGVAGNLLLLPLYLRSWSVAVYGEWMALYSVVNYLANLDFGVTAAGVNAATMAYARSDWDEFRRVQGTAWAASIAIAVIGTVLVVLPFFFYFHVERWLNLRYLAPGQARLVFSCLAVSLLANIPGRQLIAVYIAIGEFTTYQWLYNAFLLVSCLATAVVLSSGAGPVALAIVTMGAALSTIAFAACVLHRRDPRLVPRVSAADWSTARTLASPTAQFGISVFATVLALQAPVVLLSRMFGGPSVALFTTTRTVANIIRQSVGLIRYPLRTEFSALSATRSKDTLGRLFRIAVSVDTVVGLTLFAGLWTGGCWLIRFWSRGRIEPSASLLHLILVSILLEGFLIFLCSTGWATNRARALSFAQLATAVASLLLAVVLFGPFGVSAVPLGTIAPLLLIMGPVAVRDACAHNGLSLSFVAGRIVLPVAAAGLLSALFSQWFIGLKLAPDWLSASAAGLSACVVSFLIVDRVVLTRDDRYFLRTRIRSRSAKSEYCESLLST